MFNLSGPSLPPCSRLRIWISGSQMLQCPLTLRLSSSLSQSFLVVICVLTAPLVCASFFPSSIHASLLSRLHYFLSLTGHITLLVLGLWFSVCNCVSQCWLFLFCSVCLFLVSGGFTVVKFRGLRVSGILLTVPVDQVKPLQQQHSSSCV